jgi:plastocyanin
MSLSIHRAALGALVFVAACGGGGYDTTAPTTNPPATGGGTNGGSTTSNIAVLDNRFDPTATTVAPGTTVTWTWGGRADHNVTFDDGATSGSKGTGSYQRTFTAAGTFNYHCTIHGAAMSGTITVK